MGKNYLKDLIANPNNFRITSLTNNVIRKYFKKELINKNTGEIVSIYDLKGIIDFDKVKEEYSLLGYYTLITSETNLDDINVINTYHQLVQIEDEFRIMKSTLETRPIFVRTNNHILAHLTLCTISLLLIRIIQNKVKDKNPLLFKSGELMSAQRIRYALNKLCVEKLTDEYYRFNDIDDPDVKLILNSFDITIDTKLYRIGDLKHIKSTINKSM